MLWTLMLAIASAAQVERALPIVRVTTDDTRITDSCRIEIAPGAVIADENGDGVLQIAASGITVEFAPGSVLRGSAAEAQPETYAGVGIRLQGVRGVTIRGARISGYRAGVFASEADELTLDGIDASDNYRQKLASTPAAEDTRDWLSPHRNDDNEYLTRYGAALYVEDSTEVTVRRCKVRDGQNALVLDRVRAARVYDNDFSFNSGWGIALWRVEDSTITRNACDFCIRGYSHGVYNRGQDSAGILMFEQCNNNLIAENSATHGGDGIFGFAGREAIGEANPRETLAWYEKRGNRRNRIVANDFSYAAAHGIELTFSFDNDLIGNRLVGNAICGVWGGYSANTRIIDNEIAENGDMPYGLERGGINIEHGRDNHIIRNRFVRNACGVHLWWDADEPIQKLPWAEANGVASERNLIAGNTFRGCQIALQFRGPNEVILGENEFDGVGEVVAASAQTALQRRLDPPPVPERPRIAEAVLGETRPVGARAALRGRENIVMLEYGPWDHQSPLVRLVEEQPGRHVYELRNLPVAQAEHAAADALRLDGADAAKIDARGAGATFSFAPGGERTARLTVTLADDGLASYTVQVQWQDYVWRQAATLLRAEWSATFFKWDKEQDPREDYEAWRALADGPQAVTVPLDTLQLKYGFGGPSGLPAAKDADALKTAPFGGNYFGMVARGRVRLPAGTYRVTTLSDDGVRVRVAGTTVLENWTWHAPERDAGVFTVTDDAAATELVVEHFEIDGYAVLELELAPAE